VARSEIGIASAVRDPRLPRLLVVRVGPRWHELPGDRRQMLAETWCAGWRHAVPQGIVAVLDAATDRSVVHCGRDGTARLTGPVPPLR
jgi:hypothetical protein